MTLENYIGQEHLIKEQGAIKKIIDNGHLQSLILYGNPGIGKTTLANIIADQLNITRFNLNAATADLAQIKEIAKTAKSYGKLVVVIDEIHRLDKTKQNFLLPYLEKDNLYLIGTTTENPYFSVNAALRSRLLLFHLQPITEQQLVVGLEKLNQQLDATKVYSVDIYQTIYHISGGDVRMATTILQFILKNYEQDEITSKLLNQLFEPNMIYDKQCSNHHDLKSALQKSIRANDVNAALHYLARLLVVGDYPALLRRLAIIAYEDVGLGNPQACMRTTVAIQTFERLGMPEGRIPLANSIVELCLSPKSTSAYQALDQAIADVKNRSNNDIPAYLLKNQPHQQPYDPQVVAYLDNLPADLQGTKYFVSQQSSQYERALNENYQQREQQIKERNGKK